MCSTMMVLCIKICLTIRVSPNPTNQRQPAELPVLIAKSVPKYLQTTIDDKPHEAQPIRHCHSHRPLHSF